MSKEAFTDEQNEALRRALTGLIERIANDSGRRPSQREVAEMLGISQQSASGFLRGIQGASYPTGTRVAQLLGVAGVDDLFRGTGAAPALPGRGIEKEVARLHGAELAAVAARLMGRARGFDGTFLVEWAPEDPAETDAELLWAECKVSHARWSKRNARGQVTKHQQVERYMTLVDRLGEELVVQCTAGLIGSGRELEDVVRRMPVELPIDPELLIALSVHAKVVSADSSLTRGEIARRCFVLDVCDRIGTHLGGLQKFFDARASARRDERP